MIRCATLTDAAAIAHIYNHYIEHTVITFEEQPLSAEQMAGRIKDNAKLDLQWLVFVEHGQILGYAYAGIWKDRSAYRYTREITVYLAADATVRGIGSALYQVLLKQLRDAGIHTVLACIAMPNAPSVSLHEKFGMKKVAHFSQVGFKFDQWLDVGYWQMELA
jgi:L-amino acid N-acyltransferase YncA